MALRFPAARGHGLFDRGVQDSEGLIPCVDIDGIPSALDSLLPRVVRRQRRHIPMVAKVDNGNVLADELIGYVPTDPTKMSRRDAFLRLRVPDDDVNAALVLGWPRARPTRPRTQHMAHGIRR